MTRPPLFALALFLLAAFDPAPYREVRDCAAWGDGPGRIDFCLLGNPGEDSPRAVAAYAAGRPAALWTDRDRRCHATDIMTAELDGDPLPEVALICRRPVRSDPRPDNRLQVWDWTGERLSPKWLGSSLGLPLLAAGFAPGPDGRDRLYTVQGGPERMTLSRWRLAEFGFEHEATLVRVERPEDPAAARARLERKLSEIKGVRR